MQVPRTYVGRTRPTTARQAGVQVATGPAAFGAAIGQGLGALGNSLEQASLQLKQKEDQTAKFATLKNFTEFETRAAEALQTLKRDSPVDGRGFAAQADLAYTKEAQSFLQGNVPDELRPEFEARAAEVRQRIIADAMDFQYKASDSYFRQGISDMLNQAQTSVDQSPDTRDAWNKRLMEAIDTQTDLPQIEKDQLKRNVNIALLKTEYATTVRTDAIAAASPGGAAGSAGSVGQSAALIRKFEGFRETPYWDVNADRIGYGTDTITNEDGTYRRVTKGDRVDRAGAERDLERRIKEFQNTAASQVGSDRWQALPAATQAGLTSVAYNYGSLPDSVVTAVKTGDNEQIAAAVEALGANKGRRAQEAAVIRGGISVPSENIMSDPKYADIPYEDKIVLRADAESKAKAAATANAQAQKQIYESRLNDLLVNLHDGKAGLTQIDAARQAGWLTKYDDINKATKIYEDRNKTVNLAGQAAVKLNTPGAVWDPTNTDDKKMLNAYIGESGTKAIGDMNADYFSNIVLPVTQQAHDIPTDVVGTLMGMVRSNDQTKALFALDALSQLRSADERAFNQRVPEDLAKDVTFYDARRNLVPADELMRQINTPVSPQERALNDAMRKDARAYLTKQTNNVSKLNELATQFIGQGDSWVPFSGTTKIADAPGALRALESEYQTLFEDNYVRTGNPDEADRLTKADLERSWGTTDIGGQRTLMKRPPEKSGYRPLGGSYDWIDQQIRGELKIPTEQRYELFSDEQTEDEFKRYQRDPNSAPPSYRIMRYDDFGVARPAMNDRGQFIRMNFLPPKEAVEQEIQDFDNRDETQRVRERLRDYYNARDLGELTGQTVPDDMEQQFQKDTTRLGELEQQRAERTRKVENAQRAGRSIGEMFRGQ